MTPAEMEQRLLARERDAAQLESLLSGELSKPPISKIPFQGVLVAIRKRPADLGLSPADWASLGLEEGDE